MLAWKVNTLHLAISVHSRLQDSLFWLSDSTCAFILTICPSHVHLEAQGSREAPLPTRHWVDQIHRKACHVSPSMWGDLWHLGLCSKERCIMKSQLRLLAESWDESSWASLKNRCFVSWAPKVHILLCWGCCGNEGHNWCYVQKALKKLAHVKEWVIQVMEEAGSKSLNKQGTYWRGWS